MNSTARAARAPDTTPARPHLTLVSDEVWRAQRAAILQLAIEREREQRRRKLRLIILAGSWTFTAMAVLYFAGLTFGSSPLGQLIALLVGVGIVVVIVVLWLVTRDDKILVYGKRVG